MPTLKAWNKRQKKNYTRLKFQQIVTTCSVKKVSSVRCEFLPKRPHLPILLLHLPRWHWVSRQRYYFCYIFTNCRLQKLDQSLLLPFCETWPFPPYPLIALSSCKTSCIKTFAESEPWYPLVLTTLTHWRLPSPTKPKSLQILNLCHWSLPIRNTRLMNWWNCMKPYVQIECIIFVNRPKMIRLSIWNPSFLLLRIVTCILLFMTLQAQSCHFLLLLMVSNLPCHPIPRMCSLNAQPQITPRPMLCWTPLLPCFLNIVPHPSRM